MNLFLLNSPPKDLHQQTFSKLLVPLPEPPHNPAEDNESPRKTIHTINQPVVYTEGCIAAGCPEDLW